MGHRARELGQAGVRAFGAVADLTEESQVRRVVREVTHALGVPAILVNNAGMTSVTSPALDISSSGGEECGTADAKAYDPWRRRSAATSTRRS